MSGIDQSKIRNFCIIAHIDHGKSTLADRIIEMTGLLTSREMQSQVLDNMELERERGITIKAQTVRTVYKAKDGEEYIFNLIDTPGHVDFNYEVSRSLAACDGAILVVDAAQGVEAQTLANVYLALDHDLDVVPVLNKIDLPSADPQRVIEEIEDVIGIEAEDAPQISAKTGLNVDQVLEEIVAKVPAPTGDPKAPLQALIFDSLYDAYKGVIVFCRIKEGTVKKGTPILMMATGAKAEVVEVGYFGAGQFIPCEELSAGMVGYITASLKNVKDTRVGDTVTDAGRPCAEPLPGYKKVNPMVYCGLYPADGAKYPDLRDALEKLQLNDASLQFEPETSIALGFGFRCGFLGLLHLEIIQERLEREYNLDLVTTAPGVIYKVHKTNGDVIELTNPSNLPDPSEIEYMEEPMVKAEIMVTSEFIGKKLKHAYDNMVIVGWAMDIRGQLPNLTVAIEKLHRTYFGGEHQILYLMDSLEKEDAFYSLKNGYLKRRAGYYIYYAQKSFTLSAIIDDERKKDTSIQKKQNEKQEMMQEDNQKEKNQEQESWSEHFFAEMKNDENYAREEENEKERTSSYRTYLEQKGQKTKMIPSYGLSILLFLVVCGLGFAAFQNHQKMNAMETALMQMNSAKMTETETQTPASETDVTVKVESVEGNITPQDNAQTG